MMNHFKIPVVLIFFKREEKTLKVLERIAEVKPSKLYLISDGGRNNEEQNRVEKCRSLVESKINWECEIIKNYATENKGVYDRIGLGAKWVLEREDSAIFLEDDNLPEITFFRFCEEMLEKYKDDTRILWICGTNYLKSYQPADGSSYVFTKHMLPCGWASWKNKFSKFYDGNLELWNDPYLRKRVMNENYHKSLKKQDISNWNRENARILKQEKPNSWDYQMSFTQRVNGLYAIVPKYNQITNIGVDTDSTHGGTSLNNIMTRRFCGLNTVQLEFPLTHPKAVISDISFDKLTASIILLPLKYRIKGVIISLIKKILFINQDASLSDTIKKWRKKK